MAIFINDEIIPGVILEQEVERIGAEYRESLDKMKISDRQDLLTRMHQLARENIVRRTVLRQAAMADPEPVPAAAIDHALEQMKQSYGGEEQFKRCMDVSPSNLEQMRRDIETDLKVDRLLTKAVGKIAKPKADALSAFYRKNKELLKQSETVHVKHIVKHVNDDSDREPARTALAAAAEELKGGASFEEMADKHSDCKGNGGDLGYFPRGQMVDAFDHVVFAMEPGDTSDIFETEFGLHIARLYERRPEQPMSLRDAKPMIEQEITRQARNQRADTYIGRLIEKAKVEDVEDPA